MRKILLLFLGLSSLTAPAAARRPVFDGPVTRGLNAEEEKVMANALVAVVPSLLFHDQSAIENCTLTDRTGRDRAYDLGVDCDYRSILGARFRVSFDNIQRDGEAHVIDASFSYMGR